MVQIKLSIKRLTRFSDRYCRYFSVENIIIDTDTSPIRTESQFAYYIFMKHGEGRYQVLGFMKRHKGFFNFWTGDIMKNGFQRDKSKNRELEKLQKDLVKADSYEERELVEEEIDLEKEITKEIRKTKRVGPYGLIRSKPGQLNEYEEINF